MFVWHANPCGMSMHVSRAAICNADWRHEVFGGAHQAAGVKRPQGHCCAPVRYSRHCHATLDHCSSQRGCCVSLAPETWGCLPILRNRCCGCRHFPPGTACHALQHVSAADYIIIRSHCLHTASQPVGAPQQATTHIPWNWSDAVCPEQYVCAVTGGRAACWDCCACSVLGAGSRVALWGSG